MREIAVVSVPDPRWGEAGRAFVVPREGRSLDGDALRAWGTERLARFKLPRDFVALRSLPRTETGKVQKHRLVDPSADDASTGDTSVTNSPPDNPPIANSPTGNS